MCQWGLCDGSKAFKSRGRGLYRGGGEDVPPSPYHFETFLVISTEMTKKASALFVHSLEENPVSVPVRASLKGVLW